MAIDKLKFSVDAVGRGKIELNGVELAGVTRLSVVAGPDRLTEIELTLYAEVEGGAETLKE